METTFEADELMIDQVSHDGGVQAIVIGQFVDLGDQIAQGQLAMAVQFRSITLHADVKSSVRASLQDLTSLPFSIMFPRQRTFLGM